MNFIRSSIRAVVVMLLLATGVLTAQTITNTASLNTAITAPSVPATITLTGTPGSFSSSSSSSFSSSGTVGSGGGGAPGGWFFSAIVLLGLLRRTYQR